MRVRPLAGAAHDEEVAVVEHEVERLAAAPRPEHEAPRRAPGHGRDGRGRVEGALVVAVPRDVVLRLVPVREARVERAVVAVAEARGVAPFEELRGDGALGEGRRRRDLAAVGVGAAVGPREAVLEAAPAEDDDLAPLGRVRGPGLVEVRAAGAKVAHAQHPGLGAERVQRPADALLQGEGSRRGSSDREHQAGEVRSQHQAGEEITAILLLDRTSSRVARHVEHDEFMNDGAGAAGRMMGSPFDLYWRAWRKFVRRRRQKRPQRGRRSSLCSRLGRSSQ